MKKETLLAAIFLLMCLLENAETKTHKHKIWDYDIKYRGVVTSVLSIEMIEDSTGIAGRSCLIRCETHNKGVFQRLFHVENTYETRLLSATGGLPQYLKKAIKQKNIQQEWEITYDHHNGNAAIDSASTWPIPHDCHNYFSMLVFLQKQPLILGDKYQFALDTESKLWQVMVEVMGTEELSLPFDRCVGTHLVLRFSPLNQTHVRAWKTDLMTNRFANAEEAMHIWIEKGPERKILRIDYDSKTKMEIRNVIIH